MVGFVHVKRSCLADHRNDGARKTLGGRDLLFGRLRELTLLLAVVKDRAAIMWTFVDKLALWIGWIDICPEDLQDAFQR